MTRTPHWCIWCKSLGTAQVLLRTLLLPLMAAWSIPESIQASYETSRSLRSWGSIFCTPRIGLGLDSGLARGGSDVRGGRR